MIISDLREITKKEGNIASQDVKCVIFDFGRVIGNFDHMKTCQRLTEYSQSDSEQIYELIFKSGLEKEYDEGLPFTDFYIRVRKAIAADHKLNILIFAEIWGDIFTENPGIETVLEAIKPEIKIMLLSNTNEVHWRYFSRLPVIQKWFWNDKNLVLSCRVGVRKPHRAIFLEAIKKADCLPQEIVYIDDIEEYAKEFKELGGRSIVYDCRRDKIPDLARQLATYGVMK